MIMCQTTAYLVEDGQEKLLMRDVVSLVPQEGKIRLVNLFGEELTVTGRIRQMDLLSHKILIIT
ncbi:MAG TPA: RNA-binding protein [Deltaproteobacteria bacterium]|nr:RNA-binding protein [Deltaproteobacteria bacterium]